MRPVMRSVLGGARQCFAYNFDGIDDRGVLANRAINIDGDNTFEFWTPTVLTPNVGIISQNIASPLASREFELGLSGSSALQVVYGGVNTAIYSVALGMKPETRYGLTLIGTTAQIFEGGLNGTLVRTATFTRGAAREPTAQTLIGCRGNGAGSFANFFQGLQYDIRINGTLWVMSDRDQAIQLPTPTGLGAELITQSVLENPAVRGSQWTYLGAGRWQYVGDGSFNELRFLDFPSQPDQGFVEFEVESISGQMRCAVNAINNPVQSLFSSVGVFRYAYTTKNNPGATNGNCLSFIRNSGVVNCIIKNISFKPLGSSNPMQLINTTSDRWQQVPCRV
jgi:hypothetical protein